MTEQTGKTGDRAVLVTGCSSGIGYATALYLARHGFTTFATVRSREDADRLSALAEPDLVPVCPLDLTEPAHLPPAMETISSVLSERGISGLYALIQNAGGGDITPIELLDRQAFSREVEARLVGSVALLQACLPLIRQAPGGRVVWVTTPAIIPTPYVASIHACDFAVNCLARTLTIELKPWGIPNIMVRCGGIQTPAAVSSLDRLKHDLATWPAERGDLYRAALLKWIESMVTFDVKRTPPEAAARMIHRALCAAKPRLRYRVGHMSGAAAFLEALPQSLVDAILAARF